MQVIFFKTSRGDEPVRQYMENLPDEEKAIVESHLSKLANEGFLPPPFVKKLKGVNKLWELRPGRHRIIYFYYDGHRAVLLHGFKKQSQKTPEREIEVAINRMKMVIKG